MKKYFWSTLNALFLTAFCTAQNPVPNAGFEDWTGIEPDHWHTSNSPGGNNTNVTRVEPGYSGDFALKGEVIVWPNTPGFPFIPLLESNTEDFGFPVSQLYPELSLFCKFHPADSNDVLTIFVSILDSNGTVFGGGSIDIITTSDTFFRYEIPINYQEGEPYRAHISMTINNHAEFALPSIGTYFIIDDISMNDLLSDLDEESDIPVSLQTVYPNPVNSNLTVSFSLAKMTRISLSLYDLVGRPVTTIFSGNLPEGEHMLTTSVESLIEGIYICQIVTDRGTSTQKVNVLRS